MVGWNPRLEEPLAQTWTESHLDKGGQMETGNSQALGERWWNCGVKVRPRRGPHQEDRLESSALDRPGSFQL